MTTQSKAATAKGRARTKNREGGFRRVVDRGTEGGERVHRAIAGFPLDVLQRIDSLAKPVSRVRKLQDQSISSTWNLVRGINHELGRLAKARRQKVSNKRPAAKASRAATVQRHAKAS